MTGLGIEYSPCIMCDKSKCSFCELTKYRKSNEQTEIRQVAVRTAFDGKNGLLAEGVELLNDLLRTGARVVLVNPYYDAKGRVVGNEYIVEVKKRS